MRSNGWLKYLPSRLHVRSRRSEYARLSVALCGGTALVALAALAGCKSKESASAVDTTAVVAGVSAVQAGDVSASPALPTHTPDANIAALVDEANAADSALAAAALPKLAEPAAKQFARLMIGEHHALHLQGLQVEQQQGITPQLPDPDPFKPAVEAETAALRSLPRGQAYDSTYIAHEIGIHRAVIDWAGQPQNQPTNAAYRELLTRAAPVLQRHLDHAVAVQGTLRNGVS